MKVECYAASRSQQGRTRNEDAFLILREGIPLAAVCDGAGNAEQAARRVVRLFALWFREATLGEILLPKTWASWVRQLDSALLGGAESPFLAVAVVGDQVVGASAGDSQAYLLGAEGGLQFLTASADKARLGSGTVKPFPIRATLQPRCRWSVLGPAPEAWRLDCGVRRTLGEGGGAVKGVHEEPGGRVQGGEAEVEAREALAGGNRETRWRPRAAPQAPRVPGGRPTPMGYT